MPGSSGGHRGLFTSKTPSGRTGPRPRFPYQAGHPSPSCYRFPTTFWGDQSSVSVGPGSHPRPAGSPQPMTNMGVKMPRGPQKRQLWDGSHTACQTPPWETPPRPLPSPPQLHLHGELFLWL